MDDIGVPIDYAWRQQSIATLAARVNVIAKLAHGRWHTAEIIQVVAAARCLDGVGGWEGREIGGAGVAVDDCDAHVFWTEG